MKSRFFDSYAATRRIVYAATRRALKENRPKGDRIVLFILVAAAIVVDRKFGLTYVLLVVFPLALAYGLFVGYLVIKRMRT